GRFRQLRYVIVLAGIVLAARVVHLQVFRHAEFKEIADGQWGKEIAINAERGNLYDRNGHPLALSVTTWDIGVSPKNIEDLPSLCKMLGEVLGRPQREISNKIRKRGGRHTVLANDIVLTAAQKRRLAKDGQNAVNADANPSRVYPTDGMGASLVGFFREDPAEDITTGFENSLDSYLAGEPGKALKTRSGLVANDLGSVILQEAVHGQSLVLTVDSDLQAISELRLAETVKRTGSVSGSVLIMDPTNGDILAAASWPLMEKRKKNHKDPRVWQNRNFTDMYEPGSVFKIFSTASLLRNSAIDTQTVYNCDNKSGYKIYVRNDAGHDYGDLPLMRAFSKSSNVYFAKASANLRKQELYRDLTKFGFGQETSLLYPGQIPGLLHAPVNWSGRSLQTISIGQEVAVTSLQLGMALCSVANGGTLFAPRYMSEVKDHRGRTVETIEPVKLRRVMSESLAKLLREAMARVVEDGTGQAAQLDWVQVGGKTGTAQKSVDGRGYTPGAYVASFGGIVPVESSRLVILTLLDEPKGINHYAAQSAVPLFKSIICDIRRSTDWLTDVPGARTAPFKGRDPQQLVTVPDVMYLSVANASQRLGSKGLSVIGGEKDGLVIEQTPIPGSRCAKGTVVRLAVAGNSAKEENAAPGLCPNFEGLSNRQVLSLAARLQVPVAMQGVGYAMKQNVNPGHSWNKQGVTIVMSGLGL
ncbi:MAG: cell division protein FtsI/penicillin-binding protein 2, partial [Candidatus Krumholzibacteriia bacterium]